MTTNEINNIKKEGQINSLKAAIEVRIYEFTRMEGYKHDGEFKGLAKQLDKVSAFVAEIHQLLEELHTLDGIST